MTNAEQREAARKFINTWRGKGDEKSDAQSFWISLLSNVLGMDSVTDRITFEKKVVIGGQTKYIDAYIPETKVLIEQKSFGISLSKSLPQSGGVMMTPYEQGKNYANNLPADEVPRWIVTCNFAEFNVYDMNKPGTEPEVILLDNLQNEIYRFDFLLNKKVESVSKEQEISIVYNNFPWPQPDESQKRKIEQTAQAILDARALYHNSSLADLYGEEMYLYPELMKAHQANDRAVMQAYGFDIKEMSEADCVAELMKMYQKLVEE